MGRSHTLVPVHAGIGAVVLIACLAVPSLLHADYRIIHKETIIHTHCYWIQNNRLYICEGGEPLVLSEVSSIDAGDMSALDAELHQDTLRRFFFRLAWLGDRESEIVELDHAFAEGLLRLEELEKHKEKKKEIQGLRETLLGDADKIRHRVISLKAAWEDLRIPERRLTRIARLKALRFLTWLQSLQELEIFLDTRDPTFRAIALEHGRQSVQFDMLYMESVLYSDGEPFE